jgi:hypothetical protein
MSQQVETLGRRRLWRVSVNLTPVERVGRILVGGIGVVFGLLFLAAGPVAWAGALEVLLVFAGADLVVTGALGHCPLYAKLGYVPASLRSGS